MKYHIHTKSDAERRIILKALAGLGFLTHSFCSGRKLISDGEVDKWCDYFSWHHYPYLGISTDTKIVGGNGSANNLPGHKIVTLNEFIAIMSAPAMTFPEPAKYALEYRRSDGQIRSYTVSNPIEADDEKITCYAYGRGVRSFLKAQVISFNKA